MMQVLKPLPACGWSLWSWLEVGSQLHEGFITMHNTGRGQTCSTVHGSTCAAACSRCWDAGGSCGRRATLAVGLCLRLQDSRLQAASGRLGAVTLRDHGC